MNNRDSLRLDRHLEKLAESPLSAAIDAGEDLWHGAARIAKDPVVQAGALIGAGSGVSSAARDYVPLDPTDPNSRRELKRRIAIGAISGVLLGIGASRGMKAVSKQISDDFVNRSPEIGGHLADAMGGLVHREGENLGSLVGGGVWGATKKGFIRNLNPINWFRKSASIEREGHERSRLNRGHAKQLGKNLLTIGVGSAAGGASGYYLGKLLKSKYPGAMGSPIGMGISGALTGLAVPLLVQYRSQLADDKMNQAGLDHSKRIAQKRKVARIMASPREWSEGETSTITTAGRGALAGLGAAGLSGLTFGKFPLAYGVVGGALAGGLLGHHKYKKALEAQRQQYEGQ